MNPITECFLIFAIDCAIFQLIYFFYFDAGRMQKWRLRNAIDNVSRYLENERVENDKLLRGEVSFYYRNRKFNLGIIEHRENNVYRIYEIFINGEDVAKYHCMQHEYLRTYYFEKTSRRDPTEVIKIIHAANKHVKKIEKSTTEKKVPDWKADSYFN